MLVYMLMCKHISVCVYIWFYVYARMFLIFIGVIWQCPWCGLELDSAPLTA